MDYPRFFYQIEDASGMAYTYRNGVLAKVAGYAPLKNNPAGWENLELSYSTNEKYYLFSRTESVPQEFVKEGAQLLREILYTKKGFGEELYLRILQQSREQYQLYSTSYYGQLSLQESKDKIQERFTVDVIDSGLAILLSSKDTTTYEVVCSENNPAAIKIYFDGITLEDKYNYTVYEQEDVITNSDSANSFTQVVGNVFLNNEGDSVQVLHGDETPENVSGDYYNESSNYSFKPLESLSANVFSEQGISVNLKINSIAGRPFLSPCTFKLFLKTSTQSFLLGSHTIQPSDLDYVNNGGFLQPQDYNIIVTFPFTEIIGFAPNEPLFLVAESSTTTNAPHYIINYNFIESSYSIKFNSRNIPSFAYSLDFITLMQALLDKASGTPGKYKFVSDFFTANPGLRITCGDALRNTQRKTLSINSPIDDYYISTSIQDAFKAACAEGPMCLMTQGNVLRMEPLGYQYGTGSTIMDIGEMSGVTISPLKEKIFGSIRVGYPDQQYDQRSGKYEFNQIRTWSAPTTASNTPLDISIPFRADCFGTEFIRSNYTGKDSTDNSGDKTPFLVDTDPSSRTIGFEAVGTVRNSFQLIGNGIERFFKDSYFTLSGNTPQDGKYQVYKIEGNEVYVWGSVIPGVYNGFVTFDNVLLNRPNYTSISGVLDNTVFNTRISPKNVLLRWGSYLRSIFFQQPQDQFTFSSGDKNIQLRTKLDGTIIDENDPVTIGTLAPPLFLPYQIEGTTEVPQTFKQVVDNLQRGDIRTTINRKDVYLLPLFCKMSMKPATGDAQDWILTVSTKTSLLTLLSLSNTGFTLQIAQYSLYMTDLQPIPWVDYNYQKKPGINQLQPWQDWEENRFPHYPSAEKYYQKWLDTDTIKMWFPTDGINSLVLYVYRSDATLFNTYNIGTLSSTAMTGTNVLKCLALPASTFPEGCYTFVIQSGNVPYLISRHQISIYNPALPDNTILLKYQNSYNTNEYYQELGEIMLRVEGQQGMPKELADVVGYVDDVRTSVQLSGRTWQQRPYYFGFPTGIPEWMVKKLNIITATMDTKTIEDLPVVRAADSQMDEEPIPGYNLIFPSLVLDVGDNQQGRAINQVTGAVTTSGGIIVIIDPEGGGDAGGFVEVEIEPGG